MEKYDEEPVDYDYEEDPVDYDDEEEEEKEDREERDSYAADEYVSIQSTSFTDLSLKSELLRAIRECGFEGPSALQQQCIPLAIVGMDMICQAKSGMGKTAVFVLSILQQICIPQSKGNVNALVLCHTGELAQQICKQFLKLSSYLPGMKVAVCHGDVHIINDIEVLRRERPQIVVGTPGRILALARNYRALNLRWLNHFIVDECDKILESPAMVKDVEEIAKRSSSDKQVMMFSAALGQHMRSECRKFMQYPVEICVEDEHALSLDGLVQHCVKLREPEKNQKLRFLLDGLDYKQVIVFVKSSNRACALNHLLVCANFDSICIHSGMSQTQKLSSYNAFKEGGHQILVATDVFGRGIDIGGVNVVINFDMPESADAYLRRVGKTGRFGNKGLAVTFVVEGKSDMGLLNQVQRRFQVHIRELPDDIDTSTYMP